MRLRIFLIGQKWFGEQVLALCRDRGHEIAGVCAPNGSDRLWIAAAASGLSPVPSGCLREGGIPAAVDLLLCAHAHCFVPAACRAATRLGAIGYHPSLLPRHRGIDAVRWAVHMREPITGGSVYWLDDGADTGPIAAQEHVHIGYGESAEELWRNKLAPLGLRLLDQVMEDIRADRIVRVPQDSAHATWEPALRGKPLSAKEGCA